MRLHNTLTRTVEEVKPLNPPAVTVYTCGPTVYDYPHIGNWFTFVRYDLLIRALKASGLQPKWVMNITDVGHLVSDADEGEDKLEKGAKREGKSAWEVAKFYSEYFETGLKRLNISQPDYLPKATDHIDEQIDLIKKLEEKGYTYTISDGVYYDTSKFEGYTAFARLDLDSLREGARVESNPEKHNPSDFALWKLSPNPLASGHKRDMEWDSPWGKGFPGWHIECSAMSLKLLGETLDIHSGGIDHVPVHHTNEIAQSEAVTGKRFANHWMHTNHITVNDQKISKSLDNGITLEDIETKGYSLEAFRLHVLESHYRSQSKFSWESLAAAQNRLKYIQDNFSWIYQSGVITEEVLTGLASSFGKLKSAITETLVDDLNTPKALALLDEWSDKFAVIPASQLDIAVVEDLDNFIQATLGLRILDKARYDLPQELKLLIKQRDEARKNQDWAIADSLRGQLREKNLELLKDTEHGSIWFKV